ncbi:MAG TPA: DNA polymerase III subunit delta [Clostridiaceae bacterium]|nr:DNA polymerase III subunit delta [Clostridiaceae bacterium]
MAVKSSGFKNRDIDVNKESVDRIKDQLKNKNLSKIYLFHGSEPFLIDYYVRELKKLILDGDDQSLNLANFEGKFEIDDLIDACDTFPVFAEKKLVLVKNSGLFYSKAKKNTAADEAENTDEEDRPEQTEISGNRAQEALSSYIPVIPETTCLVFIESNVDKRLKVFKQLSKYGTILEFKLNKPEYLVHWVTQAINRQMGKRISNEAAEYLVAVSDPDMYTLRNEIYKLASYAADREEITLEDVKLLAVPTIKSVIFDLLDAVARKNTSRALAILDDIISLKEPEQKIFAMLSKQTGELLKLRLLMENRASQAEINRYFQGKHPYAMRIMTEQAGSMSAVYLKNLLSSLMEAEASYKKGLIEPKLALETLIEGLKTL